jgi:hypothetical protein
MLDAYTYRTLVHPHTLRACLITGVVQVPLRRPRPVEPRQR